MVVAPTLPKETVAEVDEVLAKLAHQTAGDAPDAQPRGPASDRSADARISQSFAAATLGAPDLSAQIPREQRSLGKRGALARVAIAVCLGAFAIWAWRSYGAPARDMIATWAPPFGWISARLSADQPPIPQTPRPAPEQAAAPPAQAASIAQPATAAVNETMARDLASLRQTVEQLAASQERLTRQIAKLQAEKPQAEKPQAEKPRAENPEKRKLRRASAVGHGSDVFDPAQNPTAPGVPRALGSIVVPPGVPAPVR